MKPFLFLALAALMLPRVVGAAVLSVGVVASADYDSNLNNSSTNQQAGFEPSGGLNLALDSKRDDLNWGLEYNLTYKKPLGKNQRNDDSVRHQVRGDMDYRWSDATSIRSNFSYFLSDDTFNEPDLAPGVDPTLPTLSGNRNVERIRFGSSASHRFTSRWSGFMTAGQSLVYFNEDSLSDSETTALSSGLNYALSQRQTVGGGVTVTNQSTDSRMLAVNVNVVGDANGMPSVPINGVSCNVSSVGPLSPGEVRTAVLPCTTEGQETQFFQVSGRWSFRATPLLTLNVSLGPTYISPSVGQSSTTIFANIAVTRSFKQARWTTNFARSESGSFGTTVSNVVNTLSTNLTWEPSEYWRILLSGVYSLRESVQQSDQRTLTSYRGLARATRHLTRRLDGFAFVGYRDQRSKGAFSSSSNVDNFQAGIGFVYNFDPVSY